VSEQKAGPNLMLFGKKPLEAAMQDDDRDALAAEYVLGTLSVEERDHAEALLARDAGFAETVRLWEHRLGELNVMVEAVEPPPDVWERIKDGIDGAERRSQAAAQSVELNGGEAALAHAAESPAGLAPSDASVEQSIQTVPDILSERLQSSETSTLTELGSALLPSEPTGEVDDRLPRPTAPQSTIAKEAPAADQNIGRWRGLAIAASAVAALLAIYIGIAQFAPGLMGRQPQATAAAPKPGSVTQLLAVLQQEPTLPAFLVMLDPQQRTITIRRLTSPPENGRSYELWVYSSKSPKPISLGAVGASEVTIRPLPQNIDIATMRSSTYSVSLEPGNGSATGAPTGPTLFKGQMIDAAPGSSG
jgi:anti-sigma-K factor RskA